MTALGCAVVSCGGHMLVSAVDVWGRAPRFCGGPRYRLTYPHGDRVEGVVTVFECVQVGGTLIDRNEETAFLRWFPLDELPALAISYPTEVLRGPRPAAYFE